MKQPIERISPREARERLTSGSDSALVCAYEDKHKCLSNRLEGAKTLEEFRAHLGSFPRDREIIFYCA